MNVVKDRQLLYPEIRELFLFYDPPAWTSRLSVSAMFAISM